MSAVFGLGLAGKTSRMAEKVLLVDRVDAFTTQSGNTRFVLKGDDGSEFTTFKEPIAKQALAAEGKRARVSYHEQERNGFNNVYLDKVEVLDDEPGEEAEHVDEVAWRTAVEAAPWLLGDAPPGGVDADAAFEKLQPFKQRVAEDIREDDSEE